MIERLIRTNKLVVILLALSFEGRSVLCDEGSERYVLLSNLLPLLAFLSLGFAGCSAPSNPALVATINSPASISSGQLPANPFGLQVITAFVDPTYSTMSTLYGNDIAIQYARSHSGHEYPAGSQLVLVTWTQCEDPRWYGANIPDRLQSVEFVTVAQVLIPTRAGSAQLTPFYSYKRFEGSPLQQTTSWNSTVPDVRVTLVLSLQPSLFP